MAFQDCQTSTPMSRPCTNGLSYGKKEVKYNKQSLAVHRTFLQILILRNRTTPSHIQSVKMFTNFLLKDCILILV